MQKKKRRKQKENIKNKKNWNSNKHDEWNKKYIYNNELDWSFFRSERALPGSKYPSVHIIELACMIQVFRLICFWAKTKWTYVQREKRNLFSTGETPFCWISCKWERVQLVPLRYNYFFFPFSSADYWYFSTDPSPRLFDWQAVHMDSPPPVRWSTGRKELIGEGLLILPASVPLGVPHRLLE